MADSHVLMLHVYGFTHDGSRYFLGSPPTIDAGIQIAEDALKHHRLRFMQAVVEDMRECRVVWHSAPVLRPGGTR